MTKSKRTIILGIDFDGAPVQGDDPLFVNRMGPMAFLDYLEIHFGIIPVNTSPIERITAFMAVLPEHEGEFPFYADSWDKAPFAAARRMLEWIDTWYLHGWNGQMELPDNHSNQSDGCILELAFVEKAARNRVGSSIGRRLLELTAVLEYEIHLPLDKLILADDYAEWPYAWQRLFKKLHCDQQVYNWNSHEDSGRDVQSKKAVILEYDCAVTAARYLTKFIEADGNDSKSGIRFILGAEGNLRDEILREYGRPETGAREKLSSDSASQILPLSLSLQKEPLNMNSLLAFLSLPICPLGSIRYRLAEAVAQSGGIYGAEWKKAIEKSKELWIKWEKDESKLENFINSWIPAEKQPEDSFSRQTAIDTAGRVISFLRKSRSENNDTALAQASLFCRALDLLGESYDELPWRLLEEILSLTTVSSTSNPLNKWEAGAVRPWSTPGAVFEETNTLIWFCPGSESDMTGWPWSGSQITILENNSCRLQPPDLISSRQFRTTLRVLNSTKNRIILLVPSGRSELTPVEMILQYGNITQAPVHKSIEELVFEDASVKTREVLEIPLLPLKSCWNIPADISPGSDWRTSYSQTNTLINRPAQWLLEKKAWIKKGTILSLPELNTFTGTCAHRIVEQLFTDFGDGALYLDESVFLKWFDNVFPRLLENFAYPYLETTAVQERINFRNHLKSSIQVLQGQLREAGAWNIRLEEPVTGNCFDASFWGSVDLVFQKKDGATGIIDMKYSGWLKGYTDKLLKDTDTQLTIYAELYRQTHGTLPETAYWLFPREILLTRHPDFFPGARIVPSERSHRERLAMIEASVLWRSEQLKQGVVEIVSAAASEIAVREEIEDLLPPDGGLPIEDPYDSYDPFLPLYGWSTGA